MCPTDLEGFSAFEDSTGSSLTEGSWSDFLIGFKNKYTNQEKIKTKKLSAANHKKDNSSRIRPIEATEKTESKNKTTKNQTKDTIAIKNYLIKMSICS